MKLRIGRPRCLLVVAPHADDETIGAYGLMTRMAGRGITVRVLVVTDGRASHPGSGRWPRHRLVRERARETRRTVRRIGIPAGAVTFLGFADGELARQTIAVRRRLASVIRRLPKPLMIVAPAESDDHPDHRVVATAVAARRHAGVRHLAYPVWPAGARSRRMHILTLSAQERVAKRRALLGYRTQAGWITDDPYGFAMSSAQIAAFTRPVETFTELR